MRFLLSQGLIQSFADQFVYLLNGIVVTLFAVGSNVHGFAVLSQGDLLAIHIETIKNIGVNNNIACNIKGLLFVILLMAEGVSQCRMQHLMHQHKLQLAITEVLHKFRVECNSVTIGIRCFAGQIDGEFHVHQKQCVKRMFLEQGKPCVLQPFYDCQRLGIKLSHF